MAEFGQRNRPAHEAAPEEVQADPFREQRDRVVEDVQESYANRKRREAVEVWQNPDVQESLRAKRETLNASLATLPELARKDMENVLSFYDTAIKELESGDPNQVYLSSAFMAWRKTEEFLQSVEGRRLARNHGTLIAQLRDYQQEFIRTAGRPSMEAMQPSVERFRLKPPANSPAREQAFQGLRMLGFGLFGLGAVVLTLRGILKKEGWWQSLLGAMVAAGGAYAMTRPSSSGTGLFSETKNTAAFLRQTEPYFSPAMQAELGKLNLTEARNRSAVLTIAQQVWETDRNTLNADITKANKNPTALAQALGLKFHDQSPEIQALFQDPDRLQVVLSGLGGISDPEVRQFVREAIEQQVVTPRKPVTRAEIDALNRELGR